MPEISDGLIIVAKRDCPTCVLLEPVYRELAQSGVALAVYSQDDPSFPTTIAGVIDDTALEISYRLDIETVPTLIRMSGGEEIARIVGWERQEWRDFTGIGTLGDGLPGYQPGCGSLNVQPGMAESLAVRFCATNFAARPIEITPLEDDIEACFERGWSDGLPVVPPTEVRVLRMLVGTTRPAGEVIGAIPPNLAPCTVEKVTINAVIAGCKPEYLPVVLAAIEAALDPDFCMHGLLCTTHFACPMVIVNGPAARAIRMNSGGNALGQGNRANATIGRALQLVIRNVGCGIPGGIDRATLGNPKKVGANDALLIVAREHMQIYSDAGWSKARTLAAFDEALRLPGKDLVCGAGGVAARIPEELANETVSKFRPGGLNIVRAGGIAGRMSAIVGGWGASGERGSVMVTREIGT